MFVDATSRQPPDFQRYLAQIIAVNLDPYVTLLSQMFASGKREVTVAQLFPTGTLNESQQLSVIELLEHNGAIKCTHCLGSALPFHIDILPGVIALTPSPVSEHSFDAIKKRFMSYPWVAYPLFILVVVAGLLGFIKTFLDWL